jgi:hypothetical protein
MKGGNYRWVIANSASFSPLAAHSRGTLLSHLMSGIAGSTARAVGKSIIENREMIDRSPPKYSVLYILCIHHC